LPIFTIRALMVYLLDLIGGYIVITSVWNVKKLIGEKLKVIG